MFVVLAADLESRSAAIAQASSPGESATIFPPRHLVGCEPPLPPGRNPFRSGLPVTAVARLHSGNEYLRLRVLVVVYTHSFTDVVTPEELEFLRTEVAEAQEFYWRNSRMNLHLAIDYVVIDRLLERQHFWELYPGAYWLTYWDMGDSTSVAGDLAALGYENDTYDSVFVFYAWQNVEGHESALGGGTYGVNSLLGKAAYSAVPLSWAPDSLSGYFEHEFLHCFDSMCEHSGMAAFPHADHPCDYNAVFDDGDSFNAWQLRSWPDENYFAMNSGWGNYASFPDADSDSFADTSPPGDNLSITELTFESLTTSSDSEGDGLSDRDEALIGIRRGTNPLVADTDSDGLPDAYDDYPLDTAFTMIRYGTPVVDGSLADDPYILVGTIHSLDDSDASADIYVSWNQDFFFVFAEIHDDIVASPWNEPWFDDSLVIFLDATADGYFCQGNDNLEIYGAANENSASAKIFSTLHRSDGSSDETVLPASSIQSNHTMTNTGWNIELAIPRADSVGLNMSAGAQLRAQFQIIDFDTYPGWPRFDAFSEFVTMTFKVFDLRVWKTVTGCIAGPSDAVPLDCPTLYDFRQADQNQDERVDLRDAAVIQRSFGGPR